MLISFLNFFFPLFSFCDIPERYQVTIQDPATTVLEWMVDFYDLICYELIIVVSVIFTLLLHILRSSIHHYSPTSELLETGENRYSERGFSHSTVLEIFWTVTPALMLLTIAYPSFNLLYALDDRFDYTEYAIKIIGHQWYWTYEYEVGNREIAFDSYMIASSEIRKSPNPVHGQYDPADFDIAHNYFRLLDVDNRLILPYKTNIRLFITSADVLHSWAVPSFGIKVDACPGRLTKTSLVIKRPGVYYGQCSEICGINHGFMPIVVEAVSKKSRLLAEHELTHTVRTNNFILRSKEEHLDRTRTHPKPEHLAKLVANMLKNKK
jgi:cytochrome c oxidase subunit II